MRRINKITKEPNLEVNEDINSHEKQINLTQKKISQNEMQDMVSDYLFGTLNDYEKQVFEYNLNYHQDIIEEVHLFRTAFDEVNKTALEDNLIQRTKNMSYKVQQRINEQNNSRKNYSVIKFLSPAIGLVLIIIIAKYYVTDNFLEMTLGPLQLRERFGFAESKIPEIKSEKIEFISNQDLAVLKNEITEDEILDFASYNSNTLDYSNYDNSVVISNDIALNNTNLNNNIYNLQEEEILYKLSGMDSGNPINFNNNIYNLEEEELQFILNEL